VQNARALQVLARVKEKLTGRDFKTSSGSTYGVPNPNMLIVGTLAGYPNPPQPTTANTDGKNGPIVTAGLGIAVDTNGTANGVLNGNGIQTITNGKAAEPKPPAPEELGVSDQVDKLLAQATSVENLCQHYIGWCSFW
jgi:hypothetical protein